MITLIKIYFNTILQLFEKLPNQNLCLATNCALSLSLISIPIVAVFLFILIVSTKSYFAVEKNGPKYRILFLFSDFFIILLDD